MKNDLTSNKIKKYLNDIFMSRVSFKKRTSASLTKSINQYEYLQLNCDLNKLYESEWFKERPIHIKKLFKKYPINQLYFLKTEDDKYYSCIIIGWDENKNKPPTARICVNGAFPPLTQRQVFGIKEEDLFNNADNSLELTGY